MLTVVFTLASALYSEVQRAPLGPTFLYLQPLFDLVLVTAVVHVTEGGSSQFAALYILVIASAALFLPLGGGLLIAALGNVLYFADVILAHDKPLDAAVWAQLVVFAIVALGSGYISARLKEAAADTEPLAAELVRTKLEAADILRNIKSGILTVDDAGKLLYANPAAIAMLGLPLEDAIGRNVMATLSESAPDLARALERTVTRGVRTSRAEGQLTLDGRTVPIGVTTTLAEGDGQRSTTATAIFQDISDQKRLEQLHLRTERLEAVAELSASLAHEIKNPLASIRSAVEQLALSPRSTDDERTLGTLIVRESDRLSRLLTEFLDFARVRATRIERVDLVRIARDAAALAGSHPDRLADVEIQVVAPDEPVIVDGDEDLLHRAVFNLALNALQAAAPRGNVRIEVVGPSAATLPAGVQFDRDAVALHVIDDGPGIPEEHRNRLFDPFFTTKQGGSGLGLPVVHRAIEAHRGFVFVDTGREHRGTRFTILLPSSTETGDVP